MHIFPAVLSLATNFVGYAAFARLLGDGQPRLLQELDIKEVGGRRGVPLGCHLA